MLQPADPDKATVQIPARMFERLEEQSKIVAETELKLNRASKAHKDAKSDHDAATSTMNALMSEMIRVVNGGPSDLPLFDNMSDHIARAEADPVAQALLKRLLLLIVHGYTEAERAELALYLDSLDARDQAHANSLEKPDAGIVVPEPLPEPAFLSGDAIAAAHASLDGETLTDDELEAALLRQDIQMMPKHRQMNAEQRRVVRAWSNACDRVKADRGDNVTMDDLPPAPSYVLNPDELVEPDEEPRKCEGCPKVFTEDDTPHMVGVINLKVDPARRHRRKKGR